MDVYHIILTISTYNQAWLVMVTCFLCNGLAMGINNAYGVIYVRLVEELELQNDPNAASKACMPELIEPVTYV